MTRTGLLVVVALGAVLRFWGLGQGLPFPMSRPDEVEALARTVDFPAGDLNPRWFVYPNLFFYVVWIWIEGVLAARRLVDTAPDYATVIQSHLPDAILYGRALSALVGSATVWVTWRLGRRLGGDAAGLIAATLIAVLHLHVRDSHALKADVYLAFGIAAAVLALDHWLERRTTASAVMAGVVVGLATGLKYPAILLLPAAWATAACLDTTRGLARFRPGRQLVVVGVVAAAVFLATNPFMLLDAPRLLETFTFSVRAVYGARPGSSGPAMPELGAAVASWLRQRTFDYHVTVSLRHGCGLLFALVTPLALVAAIRRPAPPVARLAVVFALVYYAAIGSSPVHMARYFTPLLPLLAALVGAALTAAAARLPARIRTTVLAAATLLLAAEPLGNSVRFDRIAARTDTRVLATRWMAEHLPAGAAVARLGSTYFPIADPEVPPGARVVPLALGERDLAAKGATHVVTHEHQLVFSRLNAGQMAALEPRLTRLAEFSPYANAPTGWFEAEDAFYIPFRDYAGVVRPGPLVRIYAFDAETP